MDEAKSIEWDIDANLPLYTRDYLKSTAETMKQWHYYAMCVEEAIRDKVLPPPPPDEELANKIALLRKEWGTHQLPQEMNVKDDLRCYGCGEEITLGDSFIKYPNGRCWHYVCNKTNKG